jgi:hypothetical protein
MSRIRSIAFHAKSAKQQHASCADQNSSRFLSFWPIQSISEKLTQIDSASKNSSIQFHLRLNPAPENLVGITWDRG